MIKKIIFPILAILILGSCSSKFGVMKRRYNKGYYIAHHSKPDKIEKTDVLVSNEKKEIPAKVLVRKDEFVQQKDAPVIVSSKNTSPQILSAVKKPVSGTSLASKKLQVSADPGYTETKEYKPAPINVKSARKGEKSDSDLIVQIILALFPFICLIAVFLSDGKAITINFWIDLILHLTFIGEIIFAILVVLDVVDLR
jgi:hypothetical protein